MSHVKIIKILLLIIIIIPVIAIFSFYIWFLYEASKLDNYAFTEDMKKELMIVANINESKSFNPILIQFNDVLGPNYYSNYELKFEISKEDFEKNNLSYNENQVYSTLTDSSMHEEKDKNTYTCYIKCTKPVNETKYIILENIYRKQRHIPLETYTTEQIIENTNISTNSTEDNNVNAPGISQEWWQEYDLAIDNLDTNYFVTDFGTYKPNNKSKGLTNKQISEIAQKGFEESAKRIAGEGASNKETEKIELEEIIPNNYFTRKNRENYTNYQELKMNAYVVTRENDMGCGIKIYIDPTTALIVGGEAYGD